MDTNELSSAVGDFDALRHYQMEGGDELVRALKETTRHIGDLHKRLDALEGDSAALDALAKRLDALEAAAQANTATVASWLESAVATIGEFASSIQGEWASVQSVQLPDDLLKYRVLEDEMEALGDEIAAATAPAQQPAPVQFGSKRDGAEETAAADTVTISTDEWEAAKASIGYFVRVIGDIHHYANVNRYDANASAYLTLSTVTELAEAALKKHGVYQPDFAPKPTRMDQPAPIAEGRADLVTNTCLIHPGETVTVLLREYIGVSRKPSLPVRIVIYPADTNESMVQS